VGGQGSWVRGQGSTSMASCSGRSSSRKISSARCANSSLENCVGSICSEWSCPLPRAKASAHTSGHSPTDPWGRAPCASQQGACCSRAQLTRWRGAGRGRGGVYHGVAPTPGGWQQGKLEVLRGRGSIACRRLASVRVRRHRGTELVVGRGGEGESMGRVVIEAEVVEHHRMVKVLQARATRQALSRP